MEAKFQNVLNEDVRALKDMFKNLNTQKGTSIKKDSNTYFVETEKQNSDPKQNPNNFPHLKAGEIIRIWKKWAINLFPNLTCHHLITPTRGLVSCVQCTGNWPGQLLFKQPGPPSDSWLYKVLGNVLIQKLSTLSHTMIILTITPPITLLTEIKRRPTLL